MRELGRHGDVMPLVCAEAFEQERVVVAEGAGVHLHHQPILCAHAVSYTHLTLPTSDLV
mgnify:CR=1 FL=1